jgi:hypothetical protein
MRAGCPSVLKNSAFNLYSGVVMRQTPICPVVRATIRLADDGRARDVKPALQALGIPAILYTDSAT